MQHFSGYARRSHSFHTHTRDPCVDEYNVRGVAVACLSPLRAAAQLLLLVCVADLRILVDAVGSQRRLCPRVRLCRHVELNNV